MWLSPNLMLSLTTSLFRDSQAMSFVSKAATHPTFTQTSKPQQHHDFWQYKQIWQAKWCWPAVDLHPLTIPINSAYFPVSVGDWNSMILLLQWKKSLHTTSDLSTDWIRTWPILNSCQPVQTDSHYPFSARALAGWSWYQSFGSYARFINCALRIWLILCSLSLTLLHLCEKSWYIILACSTAWISTLLTLNTC